MWFTYCLKITYYSKYFILKIKINKNLFIVLRIMVNVYMYVYTESTNFSMTYNLWKF